jgi:hypothetical protein
MAAILDGSSSNRHAGMFAATPKRIISTLHMHPDAITYLSDDPGSYEAVQDSACGIRGNLERFAEPIDRDDGFGLEDNEVHYTARDRSTPRVIPPVKLHGDTSGKSDTTAARRLLWVDAGSVLGGSIPTMPPARTG